LKIVNYTAKKLLKKVFLQKLKERQIYKLEVNSDKNKILKISQDFSQKAKFI